MSKRNGISAPGSKLLNRAIAFRRSDFGAQVRHNRQASSASSGIPIVHDVKQRWPFAWADARLHKKRKSTSPLPQARFAFALGSRSIGERRDDQRVVRKRVDFSQGGFSLLPNSRPPSGR